MPEQSKDMQRSLQKQESSPKGDFIIFFQKILPHVHFNTASYSNPMAKITYPFQNSHRSGEWKSGHRRPCKVMLCHMQACSTMTGNSDTFCKGNLQSSLPELIIIPRNASWGEELWSSPQPMEPQFSGYCLNMVHKNLTFFWNWWKKSSKNGQH